MQGSIVAAAWAYLSLSSRNSSCQQVAQANQVIRGGSKGKHPGHSLASSMARKPVRPGLDRLACLLYTMWITGECFDPVIV
jgi:hypothetical protein